MNKLLLLLLYSLLWASSAQSSAVTSSAQVIGEAFDPSGNELRYREYHYYSEGGLSHKVNYRDPSDNLIVTKSIDYRTGLITPEYRQVNQTLQQDISVSWQDDNLKLELGSDSQPIKSELLETKSPLVIDAGFDNFIRENWARLTSGEVLNFYFPLAKRSTLANLRVKQANCSYETDTDTCFSLEVSNWFLRLLVDPIELGYAYNTKELMRYRGLSNIEDDKGEGMVVDIRYQYLRSYHVCQSSCISAAMHF